MTGKSMAERRRSDHGSHTTTTTTPTAHNAPFLSPESAQGSTHTHPSFSSTSTQLLPSPLPPPTASSVTSHNRPQSRVSAVSGNSRNSQSDGAVRKSHSQSVSSTPHTLASSSRTLSADNKERQRNARTLPPWVQSAADDDEHVDATSLLLPRTPTSVRPASHNFMPTPKSNVPGRKFDHAREGAPVTLGTPMSDGALKWKQFAQATSHAGDQHDRPISSRTGQIVDDDWLKENMPDLETPWEPIDENKGADTLKGFWLFSPAKRKQKVMRFHRTIMNHPMVPAVVRMVVLVFSIMALSLAGAIFHHSDTVGCLNNSSTWMAIIVDVVAIIYTIYITYDEYTSKPLGLRSHNAKMSLIFLDLAFIVFESANLSLAFQALTDETWACQDSRDHAYEVCSYEKSICTRQKALTATLMIALFAWISTFTISTLRLIHRVAR